MSLFSASALRSSDKTISLGIITPGSERSFCPVSLIASNSALTLDHTVTLWLLRLSVMANPSAHPPAPIIPTFAILKSSK